MNIPTDLATHLIHYLTFQELTEFRATDRESCEVVKEYKGRSHEYVVIGCFKRWSRCFPHVKYVDLGNSFVQAEDFVHLAGVEELTTSVCPINRNTNLFEPFRNLKALTLYSIYHRDSEYLYDIDQACLSLSGLTFLEIFYCGYITDEAFVPLIHLKHLKLSGCHRVTSKAIQGLKLQTLQIIQQDDIRDDAFEGSLIEDLTIFENRYITAKGIAQLTNLKRLYCMDVPHLVETEVPSCVRTLVF
jgi:hypothetical protein